MPPYPPRDQPRTFSCSLLLDNLQKDTHTPHFTSIFLLLLLLPFFFLRKHTITTHHHLHQTSSPSPTSPPANLAHHRRPLPLLPPHINPPPPPSFSLPFSVNNTHTHPSPPFFSGELHLHRRAPPPPITSIFFPSLQSPPHLHPRWNRHPPPSLSPSRSFSRLQLETTTHTAAATTSSHLPTATPSPEHHHQSYLPPPPPLSSSSPLFSFLSAETHQGHHLRPPSSTTVTLTLHCLTMYHHLGITPYNPPTAPTTLFPSSPTLSAPPP